MARLILITGGARSGKSGYAQRFAESLPGRRLYIATSPVTDPEMAARIERHRRDRQGRGWRTVEEPMALARLLEGQLEYDIVLIDCLTLWVNNLMFAETRELHEEPRDELHEESLSVRVGEVVRACAARPGTVIMVTNEVGLGIVPENPLARRYRDLIGRCNQEVAAVADQVVMTVCGIPMIVKEEK